MLVDVGARDFLHPQRPTIAIGVLTRHRDLDGTMLAEDCGVLRAAGAFGDNQVRHRGTIGGSVATGSRVDLPQAPRARRHVRRRVGRRASRRSTRLFVGFSGLPLDELLTEIHCKTGPGGFGFGFNRRRTTRSSARSR